MFRCTAVALLIGFTFALYAQATQEQMPRGQAAVAEQKSDDQKNSSGVPMAPASAASAPGATDSQYPLDQFQNFSAIQNGGPLPGMDVDRYIYRSGNLMRMQGDDTVPNYFVTDLAKRQSHAISAGACLIMGSPYTRSFPFFVSRPGVTYEHIPMGEDKVDGHPCRVEEIKVHDPKNPVTLHIRLYEAQDLHGFPIKIENRREHAFPWVIRYKNVKLDPQDPSLFIVPKHCDTMESFKQMGSSSTPKKATPKPQ
jgi:hypothetical protein